MKGKIYTIRTPFYDSATQQTKFKTRPALILAQADTSDYVALPVSTVPHKHNIHATYDVKIDPTQYPKSNLKRVSYVRTHKQTIVNRAELGTIISHLEAEYPALYLEILALRESFSNEITSQAIF